MISKSLLSSIMIYKCDSLIQKVFYIRTSLKLIKIVPDICSKCVLWTIVVICGLWTIVEHSFLESVNDFVEIPNQTRMNQPIRASRNIFFCVVFSVNTFGWRQERATDQRNWYVINVVPLFRIC